MGILPLVMIAHVAPDLRAEPMTTTELNRLRWRCRRGMLENDLILARFMDIQGAGLTQHEVSALDRLLALTDNALWDLLSGRMEPEDPGVIPMVMVLRQVIVGNDVAH